MVAERLASTSRPGDVCGRLGGDEFVAFFRDVDGREAAAAVGHRVHAAITGPAVLSDRTVEIRTSVGVAVPAPDEDADRVMSRADAALYTAKRAGGGVELA